MAGLFAGQPLFKTVGSGLAAIIATLTITGSLIISPGATISTPITDKQVLYSNNGVISGDAGMTYGSSTDQLIVTNISFTNATGTNTTSTNLFATRFNFVNATGTGNLDIGSVSSTYATSTDMVINRNLTVSAIGGSGFVTIGQVLISPTQIVSSYSGSAILLQGYIRSTAGVYAGNPSFFDSADATRGWGWDTSLGLLYGRNGTNYWSMTKIVDTHSTTTMSTDIFKLGRSGSSTTLYVGTADGCGRLVITTSTTWPTAMTPVATSTCN